VVELLVAVFVLAVLIAILLPAMGLARASAQRSVCLSNLRSLGAAVTGYVSAYSVIPLAGPHYSLPEGRTALLDQLSALLDADLPRVEHAGEVIVGQPFRCPRDSESAPVDGFSYEYTAGAFLADYGMAQDPNPKLLREITTMYESDPVLPVMEDGGNWHPRGLGFKKNALFFDGRADWKP